MVINFFGDTTRQFRKYSFSAVMQVQIFVPSSGQVASHDIGSHMNAIPTVLDVDTGLFVNIFNMNLSHLSNA